MIPSAQTDSIGHVTEPLRHKVARLPGTGSAREKKRTDRLMQALPEGITIGRWTDGRGKPFYVRYGNPRKAESFITEEDRNDKAEKLADAVEKHGTSLLNFDPAEWQEFLAWKATRRPSMTIKDAVEKYLKLRLTEDVKEDSDTHLHIDLHLRRLVDRFGDRQMNGGVGTEELRDWLPTIISAKTKQVISKVTRKNHRKDINMFFSRAVDEEWASKNPCRMVKPPKLDDEDKIPLKPREVFDLLKHNAKEPVVGRIALELFGGLRASSAERLTKDHLNFPERGIAMPGQKHKSGRRKFRQGHPDILWAWLDQAPASCWTDISPKNYGYLKSQAFIRARVKNPGNVLRDSFASYQLALTKDMGKVGYFMQHTRRTTTEGYEGIATEADAKLVMAMTPHAVADEWEVFLAKCAAKIDKP